MTGSESTPLSATSKQLLKGREELPICEEVSFTLGPTSQGGQKYTSFRQVVKTGVLPNF